LLLTSSFVYGNYKTIPIKAILNTANMAGSQIDFSNLNEFNRLKGHPNRTSRLHSIKAHYYSKVDKLIIHIYALTSMMPLHNLGNEYVSTSIDVKTMKENWNR